MQQEAERKLCFEEFKLYYESTEKVTDRRLDTNRWNYSICVAMLIAVAVIMRWSLTTAALLWIGFAAVTIISIMAVLFCFLWIGQIRDFKKLNNAKFGVLNDMAPQLEFSLDIPGRFVSYCPFEKEWRKLGEANALDKPGRSKIIALKSSNIEYFIPRAFAALFLSILIGLVVVTLSNWPPTKLVITAPAQTSSGPNI